MSRIAILGTGMGAFGAWYRLRGERHDVVLYDKNSYVGGHTYSHVSPTGFTFDEGPHVSFTKDERMQGILAEAVDGAFDEVQYELVNYWRGHWNPHPVQTNLHGLPTELVARIIADFVEAQQKPDEPIDTYEDWLVAAYGKTFAEEFPAAYTRKYHTTPPRNMTTDWIGPRMYRPSLDEVLRGALAPAAPNVHYITGFRYPRRGGFVEYLRKWTADAPIVLGHEVVAIDPAAGELRFANGMVAPYDGLVSSIPLPDLVALLSDVPHEVSDAAASLVCSEVVLVNLGVARPDISETHITYVYDEDIVFSRLSFPHLIAPSTAPPDNGSIQAELYFSAKYRPLERAPDDLIDPVVRDLIRCGILREDDDVIHKSTVHCRYANVIYDHDRAPALERIHGYLEDLGIAWCGRYGDWGHIWTDEAFMSGERAAESVLRDSAPRRPRIPA